MAGLILGKCSFGHQFFPWGAQTPLAVNDVALGVVNACVAVQEPLARRQGPELSTHESAILLVAHAPSTVLSF